MALPVTMQRVDGSKVRQAQWLGRSGKHYDLLVESLDHFSMTASDLYVVAKGGLPLWVGSTDELVADPMSRTRCRLALDCATEVLRLPAPADRLSAIWDLEGAAPLMDRPAQAA